MPSKSLSTKKKKRRVKAEPNQKRNKSDGARTNESKRISLSMQHAGLHRNPRGKRAVLKAATMTFTAAPPFA